MLFAEMICTALLITLFTKLLITRSRVLSGRGNRQRADPERAGGIQHLVHRHRGDEEVGLDRLLTQAECADCLPISEALQQFIAAAA